MLSKSSSSCSGFAIVGQLSSPFGTVSLSGSAGTGQKSLGSVGHGSQTSPTSSPSVSVWEPLSAVRQLSSLSPSPSPSESGAHKRQSGTLPQLFVASLTHGS